RGSPRPPRPFGYECPSRSEDDPALARLDEVDHVLDFRIQVELGPRLLQGLRDVERGMEDQPIGALQFTAKLRRKATALEPNAVQAVEADRAACGLHVRGHVLLHSGRAPHEGVATDPDEL